LIFLFDVISDKNCDKNCDKNLYATKIYQISIVYSYIYIYLI
jgi:hypothetical protein